MERLNYQHLFYFWTVAKTGSIKAACETLGLAQPTISGQLALFQRSIGVRVFRKEGRKLALTENGWLVFNFADEIFSIGNELNSWLRGSAAERSRNLKIGICWNLDMHTVARLLAPALEAPGQLQLSCIVGDAERLLDDLRLRSVDLAILPSPAPPGDSADYSHLLAKFGTSLFAPTSVASKYRKGFPKSVRLAPMVLPALGAAMRQSVDAWLAAHDVAPVVKAEIGASELAKSVAAVSGALIFAPTRSEHEMRCFGFESIGAAEGVEQRIYAVTNQRKIRNPAAARIVAMATATGAGGAIPREVPSEADSESGVCA